MKIFGWIAGATLLAATSANAITYAGSLNAGGTRADFSIRTDGTLGELASSNILFTSATISHDSAFASISSGNVNEIHGHPVSATPTQLWFNAYISGAFVILNFSSGFSGICLSGGGVSCVGEFGPTMLLAVHYPDDYEYVNRNGSYAFASRVPEPTAWALIIVGFGIVGGVLRSQRANGATV